MATTPRLVRSSRPPGHVRSTARTSYSCVVVMKFNKDELVGGDTMVCGDNIVGAKRKSMVVVKASSLATSGSLMIVESTVDDHAKLIDVAHFLSTVTNALVKKMRSAVKLKVKPPKFNVQMLTEKLIIDCRFFTIFAVGGNLLGSVLCFLEGCFLVLESYMQYFNVLSKNSDQEHIIHLLIEAIDMFLVGTAMFIFGIGLHAMFVGLRCAKPKGPCLPLSNLFGLFYMKSLPRWVELQSVPQAKSRIGQAILMILQVGILEKFKNIPLVTSLDLACFAGAVLLSSVCIFLLSKLSVGGLTKNLWKMGC